MKKFYTLLAATVAALTTVSAQQLPNNGFEGSWNTATPYTTSHPSGKSPITIGENPEPWVISHVTGVAAGWFYGTGKKALGSKVAGYNSSYAVELKNASTGAAGITRNVPGYLTTGTTWSTAVSTNKTDGGTFGSIPFNLRPDAMSFMYKRAHGSQNQENATVVVYLWKGQWTQKDVPAAIVISGTPDKVDMIDRDRCVLEESLEGCQGGSYTKSDDAELIGKTIYYIEGDQADWKELVVPIEYLTNSTPTKFNVIFSANDYFTTEIGLDNTLTVDDVKLLYYSRLASLQYDGKDLEGFAPDKYNYDLSAIEMPDDASKVAYTLVNKTGTAKANVALDNDKNQVLITVANDGEDVDGNKQHVYTLQFRAKVVAATSISLDPTTLTLKPNETATITATVLPANATDKTVTWKTDNELAATVENGVVTALNEGTATITATCGSQSATCVVTVKGEEKPEYPAGASVFKGTLVINMNGGQLNEGDVTQYELIIAPEEDGKYTLSLPNFALGDMALGDIVIENVTGSWNADNTEYTYVGSKEDLELAGGEIVADVDCNGTETPAGALNMTINVGWKMDEETTVPIEVLFNGTRIITGVDAIESDSNDAPVEYYNLQGIRVDNPAAGQILIRRQGSTVTKIIL